MVRAKVNTSRRIILGECPSKKANIITGTMPITITSFVYTAEYLILLRKLLHNFESIANPLDCFDQILILI